jgi:allantoate deiminase
MLGIECVAALAAAGRRLPFALEVVAFGDEEGSRFAASMVCSRALVGAVTPEALAQRDRDGLSLAEAMTAFGLDPARIGEAERPAGDFIGYLEAHIEQGPVLEAEGLALGVVTGIAAQLRLVANFTGRAGHAGTNSMALRRDALAAAAEAILAVERICREGPDDLVGTVGRIQAAPGAVNVVPGDAEISIDILAGTAAVRNAAAERVCQALVQIGAERGIGVAVQQLQDLPASPCDPGLVAHLSAALQEAGHPPRRLVSGAGHDGMVLSARLPTAMLFVRCAGGISHNPAERVSAADTGAALQAMLGFIDRLGEAHRS